MTGETKVVQFLSVKKKKNMITVSGNTGLFASCHTQKHSTFTLYASTVFFCFSVFSSRIKDRAHCTVTDNIFDTSGHAARDVVFELKFLSDAFEPTFQHATVFAAST